MIDIKKTNKMISDTGQQLDFSKKHMEALKQNFKDWLETTNSLKEEGFSRLKVESNIGEEHIKRPLKSIIKRWKEFDVNMADLTEKEKESLAKKINKKWEQFFLKGEQYHKELLVFKGVIKNELEKVDEEEAELEKLFNKRGWTRNIHEPTSLTLPTLGVTVAFDEYGEKARIKFYEDEYLKRASSRLTSQGVELIEDSITNAIARLSGKEPIKVLGDWGEWSQKFLLPSSSIDFNSLRGLAHKLIPDQHFIDTSGNLAYPRKSKHCEIIKSLCDFAYSRQYKYSSLARKEGKDAELSNLSNIWREKIKIECRHCKKGFVSNFGDHLIGDAICQCDHKNVYHNSSDDIGVYKTMFGLIDFGQEEEATNYGEIVITIINNFWDWSAKTKPILFDEDKPIHQLSVKEIEPGKQPVQPDLFEKSLGEMVQSIQEQGIIQPVIVKDLGAVDTETGFRYEIIGGELWVEAAKLATLDTVPAIIRTKSEIDNMNYRGSIHSRLLRNNKQKQKQSINLTCDVADNLNLPVDVFTNDTFQQDLEEKKPSINSNASIALVTMDYLLDKIKKADQVFADYRDVETEQNMELQQFQTSYYDFDFPRKPKVPMQEMPLDFLEDFEVLFLKIEAFVRALNTRSAAEAREILENEEIPTGSLRKPSKKILTKHAKEHIKKQWSNYCEKKFQIMEVPFRPVLWADFSNEFQLIDQKHTTQDLDENDDDPKKLFSISKSRVLVLTLGLHSGENPKPLVVASYDSNWRYRYEINQSLDTDKPIDHRRVINETLRVSLGISEKYTEEFPKDILVSFEHPFSFFKQRSWFSLFQEDYLKELKNILYMQDDFLRDEVMG